MQRRVNNQRKAAVKITVYVVKQRRPKLHLSSNLQSRHGSHRHLSPLKSPAGAPFDRKAQLLLYSQQLRATATFLKHGSLITTKQPKPPPHHHKSKHHLQITTTHNPLSGAGHRLQITTTRSPPHHNCHHDPTSPWKVVKVEEKTAGVESCKLPPPPPSCFGDWKKFFFPSFCAKDRGRVKRRGRKKKMMMVSFGRKMTAILMSSRMEKERIGVIAKFLSVIGKHR